MESFNLLVLITGLTQTIKRLEIMPIKYIPIVAIVMGILCYTFYMGNYTAEAILYGGFLGCGVAGTINLVDTKIEKYTETEVK
jgi:hypothetical protein